MEALLRGLNGAQRAAVTSPAPVLQVLAPPGSGKTKTLTSRVAYLLEHHGYAPWNIICCTFTIKASREMRERLRGLVGEREAKLQLGTFHSICRRYLVRYGHLIGIPRNFGIADASDSLSIIKRAVKRLNLTIDPKDAKSKISLKKSKGCRLEDVLKANPKTVKAQEFHTIFTEYESELARSNLLDYDDLLIRCSDLLRAHPECVSNIEALLIDEFQDTNVIQFELMKLLAATRRRITVVGDPDQSIYGFRSAEIENLHRMRLAYPDTLVINLEENYRSCAAILKLAQDVIEQDTDRPDKKLKATHCYGTLPVFRKLPNAYEEATWIAIEIKRMMAMTAGLVQYSDIAILLRSAFLSLKIEKELTRNAIPYRMVGGHKFFDRVEIRTLLGYLRTISQPENDPALVTIINVPSRKIGEVTVKEWLCVSEQKKIPLWRALQQMLSGELKVDKKMSKPVEQRLRELIDFIKGARKKMLTIQQPFKVPLELLTLIIEHIKFQDYLKEKYQEDHEDRWENVQELLGQATDFAAGEAANGTAAEELPPIEGLAQREVPLGEKMLAQYLANIVLSTEVETSEDGHDKPRVTISTIHSAKGLEWPVVFVPAAYEGSIPHSRAEDTSEERRLLYVAMTRAQALLNVTFPMLHPDQSEYVVSQFLPPKVASRFAQIAPVFCDGTIEGMASTIRREPPSQAALVDVRLNFTGRLESSSDDLWPADGSARPMRYHDSGAVMYGLQHNSNAQGFQFGAAGIDDLGGILGGGQVLGGDPEAQTQQQQPQGTGDFTTARRHMSTFRTTMDHAPSFLMPSATFDLGGDSFADSLSGACHLLGSTKPDTPSQNSTKAEQKVKPVKLSQGSLTNFFIQSLSKRAAATVPSEPILSNVPRATAPSTIPQELSYHALSVNPLPVKRPRAVLEETTSPNRKRSYTFLSSSPGRDQDPEPVEQRRPSAGSADDPLCLTDDGRVPAAPVRDENTLRKTGADLEMARRQRQELKSLGNSGYRPVVTMHTTSMSALSNNAPVRRTLGVRRTMNGWDNRRNK
jgi:DNA helicase II / ATP-dependent DNA helicase PcrA